jgi:hypothetical protein
MIDTQLAVDVTNSFRRLQAHVGELALEIPKPYGERSSIFTEVIASTMQYYTTLLINRVVEDVKFWMADLYSIRLRELVMTLSLDVRPVSYRVWFANGGV